MTRRARRAAASLIVAAGLLLGFVAPGRHEAIANSDSNGSSASSTSSVCPSDMVEIAGEYCPSLEHTCLKWMHAVRGEPPRCGEYAPNSTCTGATTKKRFCIDRYEYPNEPGKNPVVMKSWQEAQESCRGAKKRLCGDSEWTLACEGPQHLPYPYGTKRDATACNIDRPHLDVDTKALTDPRTRSTELSRLWRGEASGARSACTSSYGVVDMTGNVDEWVVNESGKPYKSGLKGGYWGRVRDACRPMTTAHGETFPFYQTGFRCCADVREDGG